MAFSLVAFMRALGGPRVAPLTYLIQWRMRLAERALREDKAPVAAVALSLGYASESAFSTAFKRVAGKSPKAYRIAMRTADSGTVAQ